jgi:hypothetical protein
MTKDHTPIGVLRDIIAKRPDIGSERLLRVFEAYVYDDAELRRAIIHHAFASAHRRSPVRGKAVVHPRCI